MKHRLVITTEIIAPYRIPVFNALAKHPEVDLHVIFLADTDATTRRWKVYSDEIRFSYEVLPHWRRRVAGYNVLFNRGVASALESARPGVIVCGGYGYLANWQVLAWARRHKVPLYLWSESNLQDERRGMLPVEMLKRYFVKACSGCVVPGQSAAAYMAALGVAQDKIFVAPNAVDNDFFAREASATKLRTAELRLEFDLPGRYFLYVGRLIPSKGVFDLLEAYSRLQSDLRANVALLFVGDGAAEGELQKRSKGIGGIVRFAGFAHREQLAMYYALAEMFVFPTHTDPWGLVVNEAMACGLPVIATNVAGCTADLVEDGANGYVVPPRDIGKLTEAMAAVAGNSQRRSRMGECSATLIQGYSPELCAAGLAMAAGVVQPISQP